MSNSHSRPRLVAKQACAEACASVCRRRFISRTSPLAWALLIFPGVCRACAIVCRRRRDADGRRTDGRTTDGPDGRTDGREWTGDGRTDDGDDGRTAIFAWGTGPRGTTKPCRKFYRFLAYLKSCKMNSAMFYWCVHEHETP